MSCRLLTAASLPSQYIGEMAEMQCPECKDSLRVGRPVEGSFGAMESIRFLELVCWRCRTLAKSYQICDWLIVKLATLTSRCQPYSEQSENQLMVQIDKLKDLINTLRPTVAGTSFALGILYKGLADVYEVLGRIDKSVEAYKVLIPRVE